MDSWEIRKWLCYLIKKKKRDLLVDKQKKDLLLNKQEKNLKVHKLEKDKQQKGSIS